MVNINLWYKHLSLRERQTLLIGALVLILIIVYFIIWEPYVQKRAQLEQAVIAQKENLRWMQAAAVEIELMRQSLNAALPSAKSRLSLLSLIDYSTRQGVLKNVEKRIEPKGDQEVRISFKAVNFTDFIQWLERLSNSHQIVVKTMEVESLSIPEQVKIVITLTNF
jgi:general secretion pathway protein M